MEIRSIYKQILFCTSVVYNLFMTETCLYTKCSVHRVLVLLDNKEDKPGTPSAISLFSIIVLQFWGEI